MKKIASIVSVAALAGSVLIPACSASERTGVAPQAAVDAGEELDADAEKPIFADVATPKDAFNIFEASCATAAAETSTDPVVLQFVLDGSGSMDSDNKWTAASQALNAVFDDFLAKNDTKVAVGIIIYEDSKDPTGGNGPYPSSIDVYPQVVDTSHHTALADRVNSTTPGGGTPTYLALQGGYNRMLSYVAVPPAAPAADSRKVVVLISDGVPSGGTTEQAQCIQAAKQALAFPAPKGPIKTFSVGVGPFPGSAFSYDPKFMGDMAVAGGTRATPQCNPAATNVSQTCHFQITPGGKPVAQLKQEFVNAINRIRGLAVGCEFKIELGDGGEIDPTKINVVWTDGTGKVHVIGQDDVDGWTYDDPATPTKVILNGQSCGDVSEDLGSNIQIVIGCPTGIN